LRAGGANIDAAALGAGGRRAAFADAARAARSGLLLACARLPL